MASQCLLNTARPSCLPSLSNSHCRELVHLRRLPGHGMKLFPISPTLMAEMRFKHGDEEVELPCFFHVKMRSPGCT